MCGTSTVQGTGTSMYVCTCTHVCATVHIHTSIITMLQYIEKPSWKARGHIHGVHHNAVTHDMAIATIS